MITFNQLGKHGRLGNQMFQYAFLFNLAKKRNFEFGVPYKNKSIDEFENFSIPDGFKITAIDSSGVVCSNNYRQRYFNFYKESFDVEDDTDIRGFFQSEKFFFENSFEIKKEFCFKDEIVYKSNLILEKYKEPLISICIRRGNYLQKEYKNFHPVISIGYIKKCLNEIPNHRKLIVTDDPSWRFLEEIDNSEIIIQTGDPMNKFVMMCLMSKCDYQILSNSSFCWWSAWLGNSRKIFAPKNWFHKKWFNMWPNSHWNDIYCNDWIVLDSFNKIY